MNSSSKLRTSSIMDAAYTDPSLLICGFTTNFQEFNPGPHPPCPPHQLLLDATLQTDVLHACGGMVCFLLQG